MQQSGVHLTEYIAYNCADDSLKTVEGATIKSVTNIEVRKAVSWKALNAWEGSVTRTSLEGSSKESLWQPFRPSYSMDATIRDLQQHKVS